MDKERYSIIFSSLTGNTKKLADTIRAVLPAEDCDYFGAPKAEELHSEILYIGFWTDEQCALLEWLALLIEGTDLLILKSILKRFRRPQR